MAERSTHMTTPAQIDDRRDSETPYVYSQWRLMWLKLRKHRPAMISLYFLVAVYLVAVFAEFVAPSDPYHRLTEYLLAPPVRVRFVDAEGGFSLRPFVYGLTPVIDQKTFQRTYVPDTTTKEPVRLLVRGHPYKLWGLIPGSIHLIGVRDSETPFFLLGSDRQGRDLLSRMIYASRVSLSIGFIGVVLSFLLGIFLGGVSGWYGGIVDTVIQRFIEILRSFPTLPLWMALAVALPPQWPIIRTYFAITVILSVLGWTGMARVVRGKFLALRGEDFVVAAQQANAPTSRILFRHLLPSFTSHLIATATLSIPEMVLAETALSFLGIGLRAPAISWGVMLQKAQNIQSVAVTPWLLLPVLCVIAVVLAFNFLGDGLRDAADPYR